MTDCSASSPRLSREATAIRAAYAAANAGVAPASIRIAYTADGWLVTHLGAECWYYAGFDFGEVLLDPFDPSADYERIAEESDFDRRWQFRWR